MGTVEIVTSIVLLMLVAAIVRGGALKLNLPVSVLLFAIGLIIALILDSRGEAVKTLLGISISSEIVLYVFLSTLVFESAMHFDLRSLGKNIGPILLLAVPELLVLTFAVGGIVSSLTHLAFTTALLLGAILSATDPVAVLLLRLCSTDSPMTITVTTILAYLSFPVAEWRILGLLVLAMLVARILVVFGVLPGYAPSSTRARRKERSRALLCSRR
jgi:CPA1 family monovalent cation:H+ antiporter